MYCLCVTLYLMSSKFQWLVVVQAFLGRSPTPKTRSQIRFWSDLICCVPCMWHNQLLPVAKMSPYLSHNQYHNTNNQENEQCYPSYHKTQMKIYQNAVMSKNMHKVVHLLLLCTSWSKKRKHRD